MTYTTRIEAFAATLLACVGLLFAPVSIAGDKVIAARYAGVGYYTSVDTNGDGLNVGITIADWQGTFGQAQLAITTEWFVFPRACRDGYDVPLALVNSAALATFADQSQLFAFSRNGWLCLSSSTGAYYGEVYGIYNGGTGRFMDATGSYTTKFEGQSLDPTIGFRSIRATIEGSLTNP